MGQIMANNERSVKMNQRNRIAIVFMLVFCVCGLAHAQEKAEKVNQETQLREEILAVYKSAGKQGLLDFMKKQKDKISNTFIIAFAEAGAKKRKRDSLKVCEIMAEEKKDEKNLADVLFQFGYYFSLIADYKNAFYYFEKALPIYQKLDEPVGQGKIFNREGYILYKMGEISKASKMYNKALSFFERSQYTQGMGEIYMGKATIAYRNGDIAKAIELYDHSLAFFKKTDSIASQGNVFVMKSRLYIVTGYDSKALEMLDKALPFFEQKGIQVGQGNVYYTKGGLFTFKGEFQKALDMYEKALSFFKNAHEPIGQGNVYFGQGNIYYYTGKYSKANVMFDKALQLFKKAGTIIGIGNVYTSKALCYSTTGEYSKALEKYDAAITVYRKANIPVNLGLAYLNKGIIYQYTGNFSSAFEMLNESLTFYEKAKRPAGIGNVYWNKGVVYLSVGETTKALAMYNKAIPFLEKGGDLRGLGNVYQGKGKIYAEAGNLSKALKMYDKAFSFFEKVNSSFGQGIVYYWKGESYANAGKYLDALKLLKKALSIFEKAREPIGMGNVFWTEGNIYLNIGDPLKALEMYNRAYSHYKKVGSVESESLALLGLAKTSVMLEKNVEALSFFMKVIEKLEKIRTRTAFSEMKRDFMGKVYQQYEETILFTLKNGYFKKSFNYAESMKSRVFLDRMAEGLVRLEKGLPQEFKENRNRLTTKLSLLSKKMHKTTGKKDEKELLELKRKYKETENEFGELLMKIRLKNPLYASVRYPKPLTAPILQNDVLNKNELLISYFISSRKLYAFTVSKKRFTVVPINIKEKEINQIVDTYLNALKDNNTSYIMRYGDILYKTLFQPLESKIKGHKEIIIIPDGNLAKIPFESLIIDKTKSGHPIYLLEMYRIKYIQSASLLGILRKHYRNNKKSKNFVGFGDPVYDYKNFQLGKPEQGTLTRSQQKTNEIQEIIRTRYARSSGIMNRLPRSGDEIQTIAQLFENKSLKGTVYSREEASEEKAKAIDMKEYDYIHFACHGLLNDEFQSLVLSQFPDEQSTEDGYFTLNEIMNCNWNAKLVVLSACRTGSGKMTKGEGVTGLTRAVMYAGTPAVIASLWDVEDNATKALMIIFYRNLLDKKMDKVEALR
jgi:CHAT domain-containing protein/Tfp pilus assembly protein PilF